MSNPADAFLAAIFPPGTPGHIVIWRKSDKVSRRFPCADIAAAARYAATVGQVDDCYFGCCPQRDAEGSGRGTADTVAALPVLWIDIDVAGANHKSDGLPATEKDAGRLLLAIDQRPSAIVRSGAGLHVYWLLESPHIITTADDRRQAADLVERLQGAIAGAAAERGWTVDNTADLARVLRVPGTLNRKRTPAVDVTLARFAPDRRYAIADFDGLPPAPTESVRDMQYAPIATAQLSGDDERHRRVLAYIARLPTGMVEGDRDNTALRLAAWLRRDMDCDELTAVRYLETWNGFQAEPLPQNVLVEKARNGLRYGRRPVGCGLERPRAMPSSAYRSPNTNPRAVPRVIRNPDTGALSVEWISR